MECKLAAVGAAAMLEQVQPLPGAERHAAADHRDRELDLRQRGAEMGGHVVGALVVMGVGGGIFRRDPGEEALEVAAGGGGGVFLDQQRSGGVAAEQGQQPFTDALTAEPPGDAGGDVEITPPAPSQHILTEAGRLM